MGRLFHIPVARVAIGVALVLLVPLVAMLVSDNAVWSLSDFVLAGLFLSAIGVALEMAVKRAGSRSLAVAIAIVGVAAAVLGEADDAPGLVLLGLIVIGSAFVLGVRAVKRNA